MIDVEGEICLDNSNQINVNFNNLHDQQNEEVNIIEVFYDLKRRIKITRKARIRASKRLRSKHEYFEKITTFYSVLVLIFSVVFISSNDATQILLALSISLTFFTMFLNNKNYKERAGNLETNYQHLDILLNKIERLETNLETIDIEVVKGLHREYEKLIIEKENHHDIDYMTSTDELKNQYKYEIKNYILKGRVINFLMAIYPLLLIILIFFFEWILQLYAN